MHEDDLFTAPQVAKICSTDLKTIHNWVNRGEINCFRTPGRHLRFRRKDIQEFLSKYGYPIPDGFCHIRPKVIVIDKSDSAIQTLKSALAQDVELEGFSDYLDALLAIGKQAPSLVLVNGTCDPDMMRVVERIKTSVRDLPVAVYGGTSETHGQSLDVGAKERTEAMDGAEIRNMVAKILASTKQDGAAPPAFSVKPV